VAVEGRNGVRLALLTVALLAAAAAFGFARGWVSIPPAWSPWVELDLVAPPNLMTRYKLAQLSGDRELCSRVLATADLRFRPVPDRATGPSCGVFGAVTIERSAHEVGTPFTLTCRAAVSLALWERHAVAPAAQRHFALPVQRVEHFGSYACRNVYGRPSATRSRHATAEALDVAGFVLADGRRIRVLADWEDESPEALFLRDVRDGACRFFDGVLSPDYNAAHRDHLHLDRGSYRYCR
jgi:hypothetical protein